MKNVWDHSAGDGYKFHINFKISWYNCQQYFINSGKKWLELSINNNSNLLVRNVIIHMLNMNVPSGVTRWEKAPGAVTKLGPLFLSIKKPNYTLYCYIVVLNVNTCIKPL